MVDTSKNLSNTIVGIIAEFVDEDIFKLRSQSHGFLLDAMLCEQGNSFISFLFFFILFSFVFAHSFNVFFALLPMATYSKSTPSPSLKLLNTG